MSFPCAHRGTSKSQMTTCGGYGTFNVSKGSDFGLTEARAAKGPHRRQPRKQPCGKFFFFSEPSAHSPYMLPEDRLQNCGGRKLGHPCASPKVRLGQCSLPSCLLGVPPNTPPPIGIVSPSSSSSQWLVRESPKQAPLTGHDLHIC